MHRRREEMSETIKRRHDAWAQTKPMWAPRLTGQAAAELAGADLETQFASLEGGSDVDDELDALRLQLKGGPEAVALPASSETNEVKTVKVEEVDADLENLKRSIDKL